MRKDKWKKTLIAVGIIVLFILIILTVFAFQHESEEVIIDDRSPEVEEEIVFENNSDYTEEEIRDITENLRESLRDLLSNIEYYKISEISSTYTTEEDKNYMVLPETFFTSLRGLVTEELYLIYWNQATPILPDEDLAIEETLYQVPMSIFDEVYSHSSIALVNSQIPEYAITQEELILRNATNERIEATEKIKWCNESNICVRDDEYPLVIEQEENTWKIAQIS